MAVATSNNNELKSEKYLLLKIKQNTYSSTSEYKISTVQINSYKAWN